MTNSVDKETLKNIEQIELYCKKISDEYERTSTMSHRDCIYFTYAADISYRIKDIIFLNRKLLEDENGFDSSLNVLTRSVLESFIYLKYLLCEDSKIELRMNAMICHTDRSNKKMLNSIKELGDKNKFIFEIDENKILSKKMLRSKIIELEKDIEARINNDNLTPSSMKKELDVLKNVNEVAKKYDEINNIVTVVARKESESLEWLYDYIYRYQCMSVHQNLTEKENVFKLYKENLEIIDNSGTLLLLKDISNEVLNLYK